MIEVDVVVIGLNAAGVLPACLASVLASDAPGVSLHIVYADGGSRDESRAVAAAFGGVRVVDIGDVDPTPGRGRNAGWRVGKAPFVQFLDSDTILHPDWIRTALDSFEPGIAAVTGRVRERDPDRNLYHRIASVEWSYETGPCRYFGGNVMVRREVLEAAGGFDDGLIAGEEPDLSARIRARGLTIIRLTDEMVEHDIRIDRLRSYLKRAFRSGYAYAEVGLRFARTPGRLWLRELARVTVFGGLPFALLAAGGIFGFLWAGGAAAAVVAARPFFRVGAWRRRFRLDRRTAWLYSAHLAFVVYPQLAGVLRYGWGRLRRRPLRNKR